MSRDSVGVTSSSNLAQVASGNTNSISVGRGGEEEPFISKTFRYKHSVYYTAFGTPAYVDSAVQWIVKTREDDKYFTTQADYIYKYLRYYCYNK